MTQHFLHSPAARTLKLATVLRMTEEQAREAFKGDALGGYGWRAGLPALRLLRKLPPRHATPLEVQGLQQAKTLTSGTIFAKRKLEVRNILAAIAIFTNGAKGYSALQLSRDLGHDFKTCVVLLQKIRESIGLSRDASQLDGECELDGAHFGGYIKPENNRADRTDRHFARNQTGKRQVVIVIRQRKCRTLT